MPGQRSTLMPFLFICLFITANLQSLLSDYKQNITAEFRILYLPFTLPLFQQQAPFCTFHFVSYSCKFPLALQLFL